jgi:[ribosomal protein S5]-alanine N-acetyltransferase
MDWKNIPAIDCGRVRVRALTPEDVSQIFDIYSDAEVMRYWGESAMRPGDEKHFMTEAEKDIQQRKCLHWGIVRRSDPGVVGIISVFDLDRLAKKAEIAFALARAHWGNGLMRDALRGVISFGFNEMDLRRIEADVDPRNTRSKKLLEALGFKKEGYLRERWITPDETQDSEFYGLLRREWQADICYELVFSSRKTFWNRLVRRVPRL